MTEDKFWGRVTKTEDCWLWTGPFQPKVPYGRFYDGSRKVLAHRYAYEATVGPIPEGLTLDHLCRNPSCVNPAHLEPVTLAENVLRSSCPPAENARKATCKRGHPLEGSNLIKRSDGFRECRTCAGAHSAIFKLRRRSRVTVADEPLATPVGSIVPLSDGDALVVLPLTGSIRELRKLNALVEAAYNFQTSQP